MPRTDFPPVRACLFDMDGLLIDTEDKYTDSVNAVLTRYGRPPLPWSFKATLQGRPGTNSTTMLYDWARVPISYDQFMTEYAAEQRRLFPQTEPLPGTEALLRALLSTRSFEGCVPGYGNGHRVHMALATSSAAGNFALKTTHLAEFFAPIPRERRVLGDDPRIAPGRGKPHPDIYLLALETINSTLAPGEAPITPEECLVFEDAVPGVEAGRRAGMRIVWVPHPGLRSVTQGREAEVLAGRTGEAGDVEMEKVGEVGDGWGEQLDSLVGFPYERYGIVIPGRVDGEHAA